MFINSTKKKKTLQSGLFKSYLLMAMTKVAGFAVFFYQKTSAILINRETENLISQTSHMQVQTDQAIRTLDNLSINIGYSNVVMSNLEEYFSDDEPDLNQTRRLADLFVAINGTEVQADQINIFSFSGQQIWLCKQQRQHRFT
jgi:two-component system sensor histidine kinase YesM